MTHALHGLSVKRLKSWEPILAFLSTSQGVIVKLRCLNYDFNILCCLEFPFSFFLTPQNMRKHIFEVFKICRKNDLERRENGSIQTWECWKKFRKNLDLIRQFCLMQFRSFKAQGIEKQRRAIHKYELSKIAILHTASIEEIQGEQSKTSSSLLTRIPMLHCCWA